MSDIIPIFRGFGIEHELMLFYHKFPEIKKVATEQKILPLTSIEALHAADMIEQIKNSTHITDDDRDLLESLPAIEQSGRKCGGVDVLRKVGDDLLVEFVSREWFLRYEENLPNRFIDDFVTDIIEKEISFLRILIENQPKIKKRTQSEKSIVTPISVGMHPAIISGRKKPREDYTGSFHLTFTLPFPYRASFQYTKEEQQLFIDIHKNFANFIQWIEPLLCATLFTPDLSAAGPQKGNTKQKTRGSFRVFRCGWGNFAGSDLRKLDKGIARYANIQSYWRNGLEEMDGADKIHLCDGITLEPGAISSVGSDFRTFGSRDPQRPWHRESGLPMTIPNGLEIRIFDHFDTVLLYPLVQLVALISEFSRTHNIDGNWVYQDADWISAMNGVMNLGWRTQLPAGYLNKISRFFDLPDLGNVKRADHVMLILQERLWEGRNGVWTKILLSSVLRSEKLIWPNVNKHGWNTGFSIRIAQDDKFKREFQSWAIGLPTKWKNWENWFSYFRQLSCHKQMKNQGVDVAYYLQELGIIKVDSGSGKGSIVKNRIPYIESYINAIDNIWLFIQELPTLNLLVLQQLTSEVYPQTELVQNTLVWLERVLSATPIESSMTKYLNSMIDVIVPDVKLPKELAVKRKLTNLNKKKLKGSKILPTWVV